jgi:uncharacterized protein
MNRLANSKSPYLRQHATNPVNWYPWGTEALERAQNEDKWIFLSIGYSSCHWCHVMEHESFEDPLVAAYLNEHYISIKVDREERPDIDATYMDAVQMIAGHGGWPLSIWLTPDLVPVYGGTYFPPVNSHQRPAFRTILERLIEIRVNEPEMVAERVEKLRSALKHELYSSLPPQAITSDTISKAIRDYINRFDAERGGFSGAPKFPQAMGLRFLLSVNEEETNTMALHTLRMMLRGGIWDALGGGLHRYSTDRDWLVPHFEKMLYDQATVLDALSLAQAKHAEPLFEEAIHQLLEFLERDLKHPLGGYYSALDADTDGHEGLTYLWKDEELRSVLSEGQYALASQYFALKTGGNWEGYHILVRPYDEEVLLERTGLSKHDLSNQIKSIQEILVKVRSRRNQPGIDTKILSAWNALMMSALVDVSIRCNSNQARSMASDLADLLESAIQDGHLQRLCYDGTWEQDGFLDDYACTAIAFFKWYGISADEKWLHLGLSLIETIRNDFYDPEHNAFWLSSEKHNQPLARTREVFDNALPSATSSAIEAFFLAGDISSDRNYTMIASAALERLSQMIGDHGTAFGSAASTSLHYLRGRAQLVILGPQPEPFIDVWRALDLGHIQIFLSNNPSKGTLFEARTLIDGKTTAYYCIDGACSLPVTDANHLRSLIKK